MRRTIHAAVLLPLIVGGCASADDTATPLGSPVLEAPTMHSLGVYWIVDGDDDADARIGLEYRAAGAGDWRPGMDLLRVERDRHANPDYDSHVEVPDGAWLFAGSALLLEPGTEHELRLTLSDADGGEAETTVTETTRTEPQAPEGMRVRYVEPGEGGGSGTAGDPHPRSLQRYC